MFVLLLTLCIVSFEAVATDKVNIDSNRIRLLPKENFRSDHTNDHRRSVSYQLRTNDYDDYSSGHLGKPNSLQQYISSVKPKSTQASLKVHQAREDPRLYYQSASYLEENVGQNINQEVSFIYPGREVVHADEIPSRLMPLRIKERQDNLIDNDLNICIRCPHDRTLIARPGSGRVLLQPPQIFSCSGQRAPRSIHFVQMYGPKFGSLLEEGSHMIVGRLKYKHKSIRLCKLQVHVIVQKCPTPKYLLTHCEGSNCSFSCRDPKSDLFGKETITCGSDMKWLGDLPVCRARAWCESPPPPEHGRISCKGLSSKAGSGLEEGTKCRLRCAKGWRKHLPAVTVCRRGTWINVLACQKINKHL